MFYIVLTAKEIMTSNTFTSMHFDLHLIELNISFIRFTVFYHKYFEENKAHSVD